LLLKAQRCGVIQHLFNAPRHGVIYLIIFLFAWQGGVWADVQSSARQEYMNEILSKTLERYHYVDQSIDDNFSKRVFQLFLNHIDPNKSFLTDKHRIELQAYEYKIDNDIRNNTFYFYNLCLLRLSEQIEFSQSVYKSVIQQDIDFDAEAFMETDPDIKTYAKNNAELTKRWKTTIQYQVAQNYITLYKEAYPSRNELVIEETLTLEARLKTKKDVDRRFKRLIEKKESDYFTAYLDTMTRAFGPHTSYLPPEEKEDFDINMTGKLEGIGAILKESDGFIKVVRIIPGSASWRQGELGSEDVILNVSSPGEEPISVIEAPVRDAVKLIRGPKGTTVNLTVKKPSGIIKTIPIQRDIVVIKSAYAKSGVFSVGDQRFGYINLPSFYRDFEDNKNQNAADDIKGALLALNQTKGLILDLRNNGGGSLKDAVDITGFFIEDGPVVQVSDNLSRKDVYKDDDDAIVYDRPLIVLVNPFSASASEIVAAALQDYGRAIILGNAHTFGKGTVQKVVNLDKMLFRLESSPLGFIKITIQEYFRINGQSTQFKGVVPDIVYPGEYDYLDIGEKELKFAFKGSATTPARYSIWQKKQDASGVIARSYDRLKDNPAVAVISDYNDFMAKQRDASNRSIQISSLWKNMMAIKEKNETLESIEIATSFSEYSSIEPSLDSLSDQRDREEFDKWTKSFDNDVLLNEALTILSDLHQPLATQAMAN
jgi:carboxyl-terminal processing protease